jgi:hypothetical protein
MAQEFGDHPEAAASRMRWIRQLIGEAFAPSAARPVRRDRMGGWPSASSPGLSAPRPAVGSTPRAA